MSTTVTSSSVLGDIVKKFPFADPSSSDITVTYTVKTFDGTNIAINTTYNYTTVTQVGNVLIITRASDQWPDKVQVFTDVPIIAEVIFDMTGIPSGSISFYSWLGGLAFCTNAGATNAVNGPALAGKTYVYIDSQTPLRLSDYEGKSYGTTFIIRPILLGQEVDDFIELLFGDASSVTSDTSTTDTATTTTTTS